MVDVRPKGPVPVAALEWRIREDIPNNLRAVKKAAVEVGREGILKMRRNSSRGQVLRRDIACQITQVETNTLNNTSQAKISSKLTLGSPRQKFFPYSLKKTMKTIFESLTKMLAPSLTMTLKRLNMVYVMIMIKMLLLPLHRLIIKRLILFMR